MEDAHILKEMPSAPKHTMLAVFDGHGGSGAAIFAAANLISVRPSRFSSCMSPAAGPNILPPDIHLHTHTQVVEKSAKWNTYLQQLEAGGGVSANATLIGEALTESFMAIDIMIRDVQDAERAKAVQGGQRVQPGYGDAGLDTSGCTAVVCIVNEKVWSWSWFRDVACSCFFFALFFPTPSHPPLTDMN